MVICCKCWYLQSNDAFSVRFLLWLGCLAVTLFITGAALQGINHGNGIMSTRNGFVAHHYRGTIACQPLQHIIMWERQIAAQTDGLRAWIRSLFFYLMSSPKWEPCSHSVFGAKHILTYRKWSIKWWNILGFWKPLNPHWMHLNGSTSLFY